MSSILEVVPPRVGDDKPSAVRAEIVIDVRRLSEGIRREWESLRSDDAVFLLAIDASRRGGVANGGSPPRGGRKLGLLAVRTAEVVQLIDGKDRGIRDPQAYFHSRERNYTRRIQLKLDARRYKEDMENAAAGKGNIYDSINVIVRRRGRENNFRPVLESIRNLALSDVPLATWLHEVFLGYGDPAGATYKHLPNRVRKIDYRDTFLDWQHLIESLPGKIIEPGDDVSGSFGPPYVLETAESPPKAASSKPSKKRRRDAEPALLADIETLKVSTYTPPNNGPYPVDAPKLNSVRFTPTQIEAIVSGLSLIHI